MNTHTISDEDRPCRITRYERGDILYRGGRFGCRNVMIIDKVLKYSMMDRCLIPFYIMHIFHLDRTTEVAYSAVDDKPYWIKIA